MARNRMRVVRLVLLGLGVGASCPAAAQGLGSLSFEAGYQFSRTSQGGFGESFPLGFLVDLVHPLKARRSGNLDVVGSVSLSFGSPQQGESDRLLGIMGGLRWSRLSQGAGLFAQGSAGFARGSASFAGGGGDADNAFAVEFGGGYALPIGRAAPDRAHAFQAGGPTKADVDRSKFLFEAALRVIFNQSAKNYQFWVALVYAIGHGLAHQ